jgi:predicted  nucleic acid-binding Zn-ribbon protein
MNPTEILQFLIPHDLFQGIFLSIIVLLSGLNIFAVKKYATPAFWENNWHGHTPNDTSDDLDADLGSLSDLSQAVASTPEKLAEIMPGILLVIGLLGTFLGLGIALDKASTILQHAQSSGMDQAIGNLMGMMEGLGTKFKTSTWGILGFLTFKAWATINNYEERRLRWCVQKIKQQIDEERAILDKEKDKQATADKWRTQKTLEAIEKLCTTMEREISSNRNVLEQNQNLLYDKLTESKRLTEIMMELNNNSTFQIDKTIFIGNKMSDVNDSIKSFIDSNNTNLTAMGDASKNIVSAAQKMGSSAENLQHAVSEFKTEISSVSGALQNNLAETISTMSKNLEGATQGISKSVNTMSDQVKDTMQGIGEETREATKIQQRAFATFETTSQTLNENVQGMTQLVEELKNDLLSSLSAVSDNKQKVEKAMHNIGLISEKLVDTSEKLNVLPDNIKISNANGQKMIEQLESLKNVLLMIADNKSQPNSSTLSDS